MRARHLIVVASALTAAGCKGEIVRDERADPRRQELRLELEGWTLRSASDGYWSTDGKTQLFVSRYDLGVAADRGPKEKRAILLLDSLIASQEKSGYATRSAIGSEMQLDTRTGALYFCAIGVSEGGRSASCVFMREDTPWLLTTEVYEYGASEEPAFLDRARESTVAIVTRLGDWSREGLAIMK